MTAFVVDLTRAGERAVIGTDTLGYTMDGSHEPLGFTSKAIAIPHLRGAMICMGLHQVMVRAVMELMNRYELTGFDAVIDALPDILSTETEAIAETYGIDDPQKAMVAAAVWVGWNPAKKKCEMVSFETQEGYAPKRDWNGIVAVPNVSASYVAANFDKLPTQEAKVLAALRSIRRFTEDFAAERRLPPIGGELLITEVTPDGVSSKVMGRFADLVATQNAVAKNWEAIQSGEQVYAGADLVFRADGAPHAREELLGAVLAKELAPDDKRNRAERRRAEKLARKAGRRAA